MDIRRPDCYCPFSMLAMLNQENRLQVLPNQDRLNSIAYFGQLSNIIEKAVN